MLLSNRLFFLLFLWPCAYSLLFIIIVQTIAMDWHLDFLCGSISGVANCLSGYIFDTLKVKVQMKPEMTMRKYLRKLIVEGKIMTLFDGMYYPLITVPLVNAIVFGSYEFYKKITGKEELSFIDGIQNGAFVGLVNTVVVSPVQLVKCRMQLDENKFANSRECLKTVVQEEGVKGVFRGSFATAAREIPAYSAQFAVYELLKDFLTSPENPKMSFLQGMAVGAISGASCWIFSYPQDIIKTKLQVCPSGTYPRHQKIPDGGFFSCAKSIFNTSGPRGFFYGISPCLVRAIVANAFGIAVYQEAQHLSRSSRF